MACLFAGNLAGNCDAAVDTWPVIHLPPASVFPATDHRWGLRDYGTPPQIWGGDRDCRHRWGAERRIRRGGDTGSSGLMKDGRDEANGALSPIGRIQRLGSTHRKARSASAAARGAARSASSRTIGSMSSTLVAVLREVRLVLRPDGTINRSPENTEAVDD